MTHRSSILLALLLGLLLPLQAQAQALRLAMPFPEHSEAYEALQEARQTHSGGDQRNHVDPPRTRRQRFMEHAAH